MIRARWILLAACAYVLWFAPIRSGLTLDETSTCWVVSGTWSETVHRALGYQGQSPLYYLIVRLAVALFGSSEVVLRLPSVGAMSLATYLVYRIGRRLWNADVGFLSAASFVATADIVYAASDARPYALGVLATVAATLALLAWVESTKPWAAFVYALVSASIVYLHYLFASTLLVHALYLLTRWRTGRTVPSARSLALVFAIFAAALAPLLPQALSLQGRHRAIEYSPLATWEGFVGWLVPSVAVVPILTGLVLLIAGPKRSSLQTPEGGASAIALIVGWHLVPRASLFLFSRYVFLVFLSRYCLNAAPGFALLLGWLLGALPTRRWSTIAASLMLLGSTASFASLRHSREDWRSTAHLVQLALEKDQSPEAAARTPVLLNTGFVESMQSDWLEGDAERRSFLRAPLSIYAMGGDLVPFPLLIAPETRSYAERVATSVETSQRVILVTPWTEHADPPQWSWLSARLASHGFVTRAAVFTGWYWVITLERAPAGR